MVVQPAQLLAYKAAVLSRTAPDLPPGVRAEIGRLFPDTAGEIGRAWVRIWWIACSICFATLWHSGTAGCTITRKQPPTKRNPNYDKRCFDSYKL
uniref:RxLR effector candidate protein n=1 Tax=Hyaloperonospora arabidopsidis (strain Emoy2) TaxID=559515 RepID=M4BSD3_HYAAE